MGFRVWGPGMTKQNGQYWNLGLGLGVVSGPGMGVKAKGDLG